MMKQETTMNEIEIRDILCEYVGRRKAVKIAQMIYKEMEKETKHIHNGRNFFVREDENGKLVLTMKSKIEDSVKEILVKNLEIHEDIEECFMLIMKKSILTEKNLTRGIETIRVEGSDSCIYKELFNNRGTNPRIDQFLDKLSKALSAKVQRFEVPVYDVSIDDDGKPRFIPGRIPTRKLSFNEWKQLAEKNNLTLGNKNQYVLFLATMIERMKVNGWTLCKRYAMILLRWGIIQIQNIHSTHLNQLVAEVLLANATLQMSEKFWQQMKHIVKLVVQVEAIQLQVIKNHLLI